MKRPRSFMRWIRVATGLTAAAVCVKPVAVRGQAAAGAAQEAVRVLTLRDAVQRGLAHNLTVVGLTQATEQARGRQAIAHSALMPNITSDFSAAGQQTNLGALGVGINIPGVLFDDTPRFTLVDLRARLSQTVINLARMNSYRAAGESVRASELTVDDSRDVIVLSVGGAYLETLAARAR